MSLRKLDNVEKLKISLSNVRELTADEAISEGLLPEDHFPKIDTYVHGKIQQTNCYVLIPRVEFDEFVNDLKNHKISNMSSTPYRNYIGVKTLMAMPEMKDGREGYKCMSSNGQEWWQDKESFEQTNRPSEALTFGIAVEAMKKGRKVARVGWNGKGMWLRHVEPYNDMGITDDQVDKVTDATLLPWIGMKTADNKFVPWLASQTDILAEDWVIVE